MINNDSEEITTTKRSANSIRYNNLKDVIIHLSRLCINHLNDRQVGFGVRLLLYSFKSLELLLYTSKGNAQKGLRCGDHQWSVQLRDFRHATY